MQRAILAVLAIVTFGSLSLTGGYACYLRSGHYRAVCETTLSESLQLPSDIGRVVPRSGSSREFQDVHVWLPERRGEAAFVERAIVLQTPTREDPDAYELELLGGRCEISTRTWLRKDYRLVLESGLRPGFDPLGPRRVVFSDVDLVFERHRFQAALSGASGVVTFEGSQSGRAAIACTEFNHYHSPQAVTLEALFSPQAEGIRLDRVEIVVPELPLATLGLHDVTDLGLRTGSFRGQLSYREGLGLRELSISGQIRDLRLDELSASFLAQPWRGTAPELELTELTVRNRRPQRVRFRGMLTDVVLGDLLAPLGLNGVGGKLVLSVRQADLSPTGIDSLIAAGRCEDLSLERLSAGIGCGRMSGQSRLVITDLTVAQNRLVSADGEITVAPSEEPPNWIERDLLSEALRRATGISLPAFLPERFEYAQFGVRFEVRDEMLYLFGTHGPGQKTILTARIADQDWGVLREPVEPIDLGKWLDDLRQRAAEHLRERLDSLSSQETWQRLKSGPARRPVPADRPSAPE